MLPPVSQLWSYYLYWRAVSQFQHSAFKTGPLTRMRAHTRTHIHTHSLTPSLSNTHTKGQMSSHDTITSSQHARRKPIIVVGVAAAAAAAADLGTRDIIHPNLTSLQTYFIQEALQLHELLRVLALNMVDFAHSLLRRIAICPREKVSVMSRLDQKWSNASAHILILMTETLQIRILITKPIQILISMSKSNTNTHTND